MFNCEWPDCDRPWKLFYLDIDGHKVHYCVEHYDLSASHWQYQAVHMDNPYARDMVRKNGW